MPQDSWSLVDVVVPTPEVELVSDALWGMGVVAIEETAGPEGQVTLRTSMGETPDDFVARVHEMFPALTVSVATVDRSVADTWRQHAEPTQVTDDVWLVPAWCDPPPGTTAILVEPLDTFGLGNHPTTVLALRLALRHVPRGSRIFDLGSGSGVLAVAMAKVAGCRAFAHDIAESARLALTTNAELNSVTTCEWIDGHPATQVDAVLANILAPVLEAEAERVTASVGANGLVVLSGIRDDQVNRVLARYDSFDEVERTSTDGWCAIALRKRNVKK